MQDIIQYNREPLNHYRVILDLPEKTRSRLAKLKTAFDEYFKGVKPAAGQPFIDLARFALYENEEQPVLDELYRIALGVMPFKLHLKNFDHLEKKEIFITVEDTGPLAALVQQLKKFIPSAAHTRFTDRPRVSFARDLESWQFEKVAPVYLHKKFSATFLVTKMLLLKQTEGSRSWQILGHLFFQNQWVPDA